MHLLQLYDRRSKFIRSNERELWRQLSGAYMSDEETDTENEGFIVHKVEWRSRVVNRLIAKLDERYNSSRTQNTNSKRRSTRSLGSASQRSPPKGALRWAISEQSSPESSPTSTEQSVSAPSLPLTPLPSNTTTPNTTTPRRLPVELQSTFSTPTGSSATSPRIQLQFDDNEDDDLELDRMIMNATRQA